MTAFEKPLDLTQLRGVSLLGAGSLNLEQYSGLWAIEEHAFATLWQMVSSLDLVSHVQAGVVKQAAVTRQMSVSGSQNGKGEQANIGIIEIRGAMTKQGSSLSDAGSTVRIRQSMRAARQDPDLDAVMVIFDTPGGTVSGTSELADEYAQLTAAKPTISFVEDTMASAGLWVGSQGRAIYANSEHATVGSKGVLFALYDMSGAAAKEGVRPVVIRTGDLKGAGFPGTEITADQIQHWQTMVDATNESFDKAMKSRKISGQAAQDLSRGGVFSAKAAVGMGLIDGIRSFDAALSELRSMVPKGSTRKVKAMSDVTVPLAANLGELEAACKGADNDFLLAQLRQGATIQTAQANWMSALNARLTGHTALQSMADDLKKQLAESNDKLATSVAEVTKLTASNATLTKELAEANASLKKAKGFTGYRPVSDTGPNKGKKVGENDDDEDDDEDGGGNKGGGKTATDRWHSALKAKMKGGKVARDTTVQKLVAEDPELHAAYLEEANENRPVSSRR
jgi:signal peptide peptidase SppA